MSGIYPNPHPLSCPWYPYAEQFGSPNIKWCEETLCSWISEPANTWSNALYILFGLYLIFRTLKAKNFELKVFGPMMFLMGLFSLIYHASNNYFSQIFDFVGMYLLTYWMLVINLRRVKLITKKLMIPVYSTLCVVSTVIIHFMYINGIKFQLIIVFIALSIVITEIFSRKINKAKNTNYFITGLIFLIIAETFSLLDVNRILCDPENHILQGHAIWHLLAAIGLYFTYLYYEKIDYKNLE